MKLHETNLFHAPIEGWPAQTTGCEKCASCAGDPDRSREFLRSASMLDIAPPVKPRHKNFAG